MRVVCLETTPTSSLELVGCAQAVASDAKAGSGRVSAGLRIRVARSWFFLKKSEVIRTTEEWKWHVRVCILDHQLQCGRPV